MDDLLAQALRDPSLLSQMLFENPWPIVVGLLVVWLIMRAIGRRTERKAVSRASWGALVLAGVAIAVASMVDTPREKLADALTELMLSIERGDEPTFHRIVPEDATATYLGLSLQRNEIDKRLDEVDLKDLTLLRHESALINDQTAASVIRVRITGGAGFLDITNWSITWKYRDDQWQAVQFEYLGRPDNLLGE